MRQRIVIDTNVYVNTFICPDSIPARAVEKAWQQAQTLVSLETWMELRIVLNRPKLARYVKPDLLDPFLRNVWAAAEPIVIAFPSAPAAIRATTSFWKLRCMGGPT